MNSVAPEGVLLIDKPKGMTSHDVVSRLRRVLNMKRIGHAGTLDPDATGLLVICLGAATKISSLLMDSDKTYRAQFCLGKETDTYDSTGTVVRDTPVTTTPLELRKTIASFEGDQEQVPPPFSAVKVKGKKLYEYARKDQLVEAPPRTITVRAFRLLSFESPSGQVEIVCSKGTYVRSLVHDMGTKLGVGAMTTAIRRIQSGSFDVSEGLTLSAIEDCEDGKGLIQDHLLPISKALMFFPQLRVGRSEFLERISHGASLSREEVSDCEWKVSGQPNSPTCLVVNGEDDAIALASLEPDLSLRVRRVI